MIHKRTPDANTRQKCLVCEGIRHPITSNMDLNERIHTFAAKSPTKAPDVFVAPGAVLVGDVQVGPQASIWFQATVRADLNTIRIGARSNIQDGAVIHVADAHGTVLGADVTVGHCAVLHACTVGDAVLIGMNAVVLDGAVIGAHSIVGANALVTAGTRVPEGSLFLGSPGKVVRTLSAQEQADIASWAERYVLLSEAYRSGLACVETPIPAAPPSA
jgi:carbonic anhydrase/acetyltransferase-like protein (isoleucine patch superfamily)